MTCETLFGAKRMLVVASHPDDEVLGCGGTVARFIAEGGEAHALILSGITTSRKDMPEGNPEAEQEGYNAAKIVGYASYNRHGLPDNRFETLPLDDLIEPVYQMKNKINPDIVLTHDPADMNTDHGLTHKAVMIAFRPVSSDDKTAVMTFETLSSTEWQDPAVGVFTPNCYVDIGGYLDAKVKAFECYKSEMGKGFHPRTSDGIKNLAAKRGNEISTKAAEAFRIVRISL